MRNFKKIIVACLILLAVLLSFLPVLKNDFTNWDDDVYVTENPQIKVISPATIKTISTNFFMGHYHPLTLFSYMLEYKFFKLDPFVYHLDNLILHLLNCLLVFWLFYLLSSNLAIAAIVSLLFGIHPMQVESVAWVSERKNLLYAFFYLGALISYIYYLKYNTQPQPQPPGYTGAIPLSARYKPQPIYRYYYLCLILFFLSLLSKSMAITLPLVLLLLDYYFLPKLTISSLVKKIPFFILAFIFGVVALLFGHLENAGQAFQTYSFLTRIKGAAYDIVFYLSKLLFPAKLSVLYPYAEIGASLLYLAALVVVITLLAVVIISHRYTKKAILGGGIFLIMTFPALRFLPLKEMLMADRYIYLSTIGIFYLFAQGFIRLYQHRAGHYRLSRVLLAAALILGVVFLGSSTWKRSRLWKDDLSLWSDVLEKYPDSAIAYNNRGMSYLEKGQHAKASADFKQAINLEYAGRHIYKNRIYFSWNLINANLNLALVYDALGEKEAAINTLQTVIKFNPDYENAYFHLADIYSSLGDNDKAVQLYKKLIAIRPDSAAAHNNLGVLYVLRGDQARAAFEFRKAIQLDPTYLASYVQLAGIYQVLRETEKLEALYKKAVSGGLDFFMAYYSVGNLYADTRREKEAILLYKKAIRIDPDSKEACLGLGNTYLALGKNKEAISWLEKSLKLDPQFAPAHNSLALAYYFARRYSLAVQHCDQALKLGYPVSVPLRELLRAYKNTP